MAKAARVLAALKRDGWAETRRSGSHRVLVKDDQQRIAFALEGDPRDYDTDAEALTLDENVAPAA
jgi:hypothetical protein